MGLISQHQVEEILRVPHFSGSGYSHLDLNENLDFYRYYFVEPLLARPDADAIATVADIGAGYGWLSIAFALAAQKRILALDMNAERLVAARRIADIMGVLDKIEWRVGSVGSLPMAAGEADASYCVEVIEHTGRDRGIVRDLARVSGRYLTITTPNLVFPVIHHDTALPFCHWLPIPLRNLYASACGRRRTQDNNLFWSPGRLQRALPDFERITGFFQFADYAAYRRAERALAAGRRAPPGLGRRLRDRYYRIAALAGRRSIYLLPNLASTFRRRGG